MRELREFREQVLEEESELLATIDAASPSWHGTSRSPRPLWSSGADPERPGEARPWVSLLAELTREQLAHAFADEKLH